MPDWTERYAATGWYLAAILGLASAFQFLGHRTLVVADAGRVLCITLYVTTIVLAVLAVLNGRRTLLLFTASGALAYIGLASEAIVNNIRRFGEPPSLHLGVNILIFGAGLLSFFFRLSMIRQNNVDPPEV